MTVDPRVMVVPVGAREHPLYVRMANSLAAALWLLTVSRAAGFLEKTRWSIGSSYLVGVLLCLGGIFLLRTVWLARRSAVMFDEYTRFVFGTLVAWCVVTLLRMNWLDWSTTVRLAWAGPFFAWAWMVPLSMVLGSDVGMWRRTLSAVVHLSTLGCALFIGGWLLLSLPATFRFAEACQIALLFWHYLPKQARRIVLLGSFINVFMSLLGAARNEVVASGLLICFASLIQFTRYHVSRPKVRIRLILAFAVVAGLIGYVASVDRVPLVGDYVNSGITAFKGKMFTNTRGGEEGAFFPNFFADMKGKDYVLGRGCMGMYRVEAGSFDMGFWSAGRQYIECGYLQIILNGGLIMLILILALAVPAIYLGLFQSRNWFTRGCAFIVLVRLLEMVPFGLPCADVRYVLFWMAVGACLTWRLRALSEADITWALASR